MAGNENQKIHIALIISIIMTVILGVISVLFIREYNAASALAASNKEAADTANTGLRNAQDEIVKLKGFIGVAATEQLAAAEAKYVEDMKSYAATVPEGQRSYSQALQSIFNSNSQAQNQLTEANTQIEQLKVSNAAFEKAKQTELEQLQAALTKASDDLAAERASFTQQIATKNQENTDLAAKVAMQSEQLTTVQAETAKKLKEKDDELNKLTLLNKGVVEKINKLTNPTFEVPDGEIRRVDQRTRTVWINLGDADQLRRQVTFSVHGASESTPGTDSLKGKIEVVQILGDHLAEAQILEDELTNPISPGDKIFTPLWDAGGEKHFAITGVVDLDGDKKDDREMLKKIISASGGVLDAEVTVTGEKVGEVNVRTRYLIEGFEPAEAALAAHTEMRNEADRNGVARISVEEFLLQIGWRDSKQVLRFGANTNINDIPRENVSGRQPVSSGSVSDLFQKRLPPGKANSAYKK